jgi:hypothetical protein
VTWSPTTAASPFPATPEFKAWPDLVMQRMTDEKMLAQRLRAFLRKGR